MKLEPFDLEDFANLGRPKYFVLETYLEACRMLVASDECEAALYLLDHLPGWYRDNPPAEVLALRLAINRDLLNVFNYAADPAEQDAGHEAFHMDHPHCYPRGPMLRELVRYYHDQGIVPHVHEVSPANFWACTGLQEAGLGFTYSWDSLSLSRTTRLEIGPGPLIYVCFETIEHLANPADIYHWAAKLPREPDVVMLSTPTYCLYHGLEWHESRPRELGHLRTYSPTELIAFAAKYWPAHKHVQLVRGNMQVLCASREPLGLEFKV